MPQLIYVYGDDMYMIDTLLSALRGAGYALETTDLEQVGISDMVTADIALICKAAGSAHLTFGGLILDVNNRTVWLSDGETQLHITRNEFALLRYLIENEGRAVARAELLPRIWGIEQGQGVSSRAADDTVKRLRKKLAGTGITIETIWGYGFRIILQE